MPMRGGVPGGIAAVSMPRPCSGSGRRQWNQMRSFVRCRQPHCSSRRFCLGLLASSAVSLLTEHVECSPSALRVRLSVWKVRPARELTPACYLRVAPDLLSPLEFLIWWSQRRTPSALWFALPGAPPLTSTGLTRVLRHAVLHKGGDAQHLSSHSLRIGAHSEQVLLGIPLEVGKARFGWAPNSPMECVYLDREMRLSLFPQSGFSGRRMRLPFVSPLAAPLSCPPSACPAPWGRP